MGPTSVTLREITRANVNEVMDLAVAPEQDDLVAPNAVSIAQSHYEERSWMRGIYVGDTPVGLVLTIEDPDRPLYYLWRLMIAAEHQGRGHGRAAVDQVIDRIAGIPTARELTVSVAPDEGNAVGFYERLGFVDTGEVHDGELVFVRPLR